MDTRDGTIHTAEQVRGMSNNDRQFMREMGIDPTPRQIVRGKVGRNDPCPCRSGIKFKKCCLIRRAV